MPAPVMFAGHGLACRRGDRLVLSGVNFRIAAGDALLLVGPNGCGKSTLLRLMAGLLRPTAGRIAWDGADIAADPEPHRRRLAYVGHADAVKPALTVREQLAFWRSLHDAGTGAAGIHAVLARLGIGHLADLPGRYLSAGQRRRIGLARLLLAPAPLWLLDEPRTSLDADANRRLDDLIARHRDSGGIVVMATHADAQPPAAIILDLTPPPADAATTVLAC